MDTNIEIKEIVQRAKEKNEQAQTYLVRLTYQKAYFIAYNIVRNEEIAKDILQEAYITAFQKIYQLKDDEKFIGWFNRIVNNKTIDFLRSKEGKNQDIVFSTLDNEQDDLIFEDNIQDERIEWNPKDNMDYQVLKEGLEEVLNTLPEKQRLALLMYYFEEKSISEIAETMGVGQSAIKSALAYGRQKIKDCIESMRAKGTSFYGFAPLSIFMNVMDFESSKVSLEGVSSIVKVVTETGGVVGGTIATAEASKHGASGIAKWWASKSAGVKIGACVATTAVAGGTYAIATNNSTTWEYTTDIVNIVSDETYVGFYPNIEFTFEYSPITKEITCLKTYSKFNPDEIIEYARNENEVYGDMAYQLYSKEGLEHRREQRQKIEGITFTSDYLDNGMFEETTIVDMKDFSSKDEDTQISVLNQYGILLHTLYNQEDNKFYYSDSIENELENLYDFQGNVVGKIDFEKK